MTTPSEVGLLRLVAQRIAGPRPGSAAEVVRRLTATQGQDYPGAVTSVALRTTARRRDDVVAALDDGSIVRSWPMRGTLHLLAAEDLHWMLQLLGPRALVGLAGRLDGEEALAELALRYFTGHGPATVHDLARWAGIGVREARAGLAAVPEHLASTEVEGTEYLMDPRTPELLEAHRDEARGTFLLPGFDEFVLGYRDRGAVLDPEFADRIAPGNNGVFRPTVVSDGRIVGTWQWSGKGARRSATASPFGPGDGDVMDGVPALAAALP